MLIVGELVRDDIKIGNEIEILDESVIEVQIECWFDVDKKFGTNTHEKDDVWINLYAEYNHADSGLNMTVVVDDPDDYGAFKYEPTNNEKELIITMIEEKVQELYRCSVDEFLRSL